MIGYTTFRKLIYFVTDARDKAIADFQKYLELSDDPVWRQIAEEQLRQLDAPVGE